MGDPDLLLGDHLHNTTFARELQAALPYFDKLTGRTTRSSYPVAPIPLSDQTRANIRPTLTIDRTSPTHIELTLIIHITIGPAPVRDTTVIRHNRYRNLTASQDRHAKWTYDLTNITAGQPHIRYDPIAYGFTRDTRPRIVSRRNTGPAETEAKALADTRLATLWQRLQPELTHIETNLSDADQLQAIDRLKADLHNIEDQLATSDDNVDQHRRTLHTAETHNQTIRHERTEVLNALEAAITNYL